MQLATDALLVWCWICPMRRVFLPETCQNFGFATCLPSNGTGLTERKGPATPMLAPENPARTHIGERVWVHNGT